MICLESRSDIVAEIRDFSRSQLPPKEWYIVGLTFNNADHLYCMSIRENPSHFRQFTARENIHKLPLQVRSSVVSRRLHGLCYCH